MTDFYEKLPNRGVCSALAHFLYKESVKMQNLISFIYGDFAKLSLSLPLNAKKEK